MDVHAAFRELTEEPRIYYWEIRGDGAWAHGECRLTAAARSLYFVTQPMPAVYIEIGGVPTWTVLDSDPIAVGRRSTAADVILAAPPVNKATAALWVARLRALTQPGDLPTLPSGGTHYSSSTANPRAYKTFEKITEARHVRTKQNTFELWEHIKGYAREYASSGRPLPLDDESRHWLLLELGERSDIATGALEFYMSELGAMVEQLRRDGGGHSG